MDSKDTIADILKLIDDSNDLIGDINSNSSALSSIDNKLEDLEDKFKESDIFNPDYWNEVNSLVNDLEKNMIVIQDLKNKLSQDLILIKQDINQNTNKLNDLQSNSNIINSSVTSIKVKNVSKIVNPITTDIRPVIPNKSYLNYLFPTLIVLIIMFSSVLLSSTASIVEKKDRAFFRNLISPTNNLIFLITRFVTDFFIVFIQLIIFFIISLLFLKIGIFFNFNTLLILFVIISLFILLGILIGSISHSEETSILFSLIITSIMLFFSSTILPTENMSNILYKISKFNPFVLAESALRKSIVYGLSIEFIWKEIFLLFIWVILTISIIFIITKVNIKQFKELIKNMVFVEE